jgi:hypothetical protein
VFYDHGDRSESNVAAIKGFCGDKVSNLNRLADVDVTVVSPDPDKRVRLLIEIEERECSPKKILGNIMAILICNRFAIRRRNQQQYFDVDRCTHIVVAGALPPQGDRLKRIDRVILPRIRQFPSLSNGVNPANVDLVFRPSMDSTIDALKTMIQTLLPT